MPSNYTQHYKLSQWAAADKVQRIDFNADNAKIDAALAGKAEASALAALQKETAGKGNCEIFMGSYVGTGGLGEAHPNTLTFPKKPLVVFVWDYAPMIAVGGCASGWIPGDGWNTQQILTWTGNTLSWYKSGANSTSSPGDQLNAEGRTYFYLALMRA